MPVIEKVREGTSGIQTNFCLYFNQKEAHLVPFLEEYKTDL